MKRVSLLSFLLLISFTLAMAQADPSTLNKTGDKAPTFSCKTIDGKTYDLKQLKGKTVMINFFATWCGPCNAELPVLQKNVWEKYKDRNDFVLLVIGREHSEAEVRAFAENKKFNMPFAPDPDREIYKLYATQTIPRNIIIDKEGRIAYQGIGYTEAEFSELESILARQLGK